MTAAYISFVPDLFDLRWIHACQERLQHFPHDRFDQLAVARAGAEARNPLIRFDLNQCRRPKVSHTRPTENLSVCGNRRAQSNRLDVCDLHSRYVRSQNFPSTAVPSTTITSFSSVGLLLLSVSTRTTFGLLPFFALTRKSANGPSPVF